MTLIELLALIAFVTAFIAVSRFAGHLIGISPWYVAALLLVALVILIRRARQNIVPICVNRICSYDQFRRLEPGKSGSMLQCRCGQRYIRRGASLMKVLDNGTEVPFLRRHFLRGWIRASPDEHSLQARDDGSPPPAHPC